MALHKFPGQRHFLMIFTNFEKAGSKKILNFAEVDQFFVTFTLLLFYTGVCLAF